MSKFLILSDEFMATSLAFRLQEIEKQEVRVFCLKQEGKDHLRGIIKQVNSLQAGLSWVGKDGYIIREDEKDVTRLRRLGYKVYGGNALTERMENDRMFELETCKAAGIEISNFHRIKTLDEGIAFVEKHPDQYVLKQEGNLPKHYNYVGTEEDGSDVILQMKWMKEQTDFKSVENASFILQEIVDGDELAVGAYWMYGDWLRDDDGKVIQIITREHKKAGNGDTQLTCGEAGTVVKIQTENTKLFDATINKLTPWLKKHCADVCLYIDANCGIIDDGTAYLFEITPRNGYPLNTCVEWLLDTPMNEFYANLIDGEQGGVEFKKGWGVVTVLGCGRYPLELKTKEHSFKGQPVTFPDEDKGWNPHISPDYILWDEKDQTYRVADDFEYVCCVSFDAEEVAKANKGCVDTMKKIVVRAPNYRTDIGEKFQKEELPELQKLGYL